MVVTALLMGVALKDDQPLSDAEIRLRATALGMVEGDSRTLADVQASRQPDQSPPDMSGSAQTPEETASPTPDPGIVPTASPTPDPGPVSTATSTPDPGAAPTAASTPTPDPGEEMAPPLPRVTPKPAETDSPDMPLPSAPTALAPTPEPPESVTFVIHSGQSSYGVSKSLAEAGLVEDASDFDRYLEDNGYSKRISTGTYEIPLDATEEEIAKIITRSR